MLYISHINILKKIKQIVGADGKKIKVKRKEYIDKDGAKVTEEERIGANGKVEKIKKKEYIDKDGNRVIEEEITDEFGNKIIRKRKIGKDGKEVIEEIRVGKDGKREIIKKVINADGTVEETKINADGTVEVKKYKLGFDDKSVQTNISGPVSGSLEDALRAMGVKEKEVAVIAEAIRRYLQTGEVKF